MHSLINLKIIVFVLGMHLVTAAGAATTVTIKQIPWSFTDPLNSINDVTYSDRLGMTCEGTRCVKKDGIEYVQIPAGEDLEIDYVNQLTDSNSSIHAHGQQPPQEQDGVPDLDAPPMKASGGIQASRYKPEPGTYFVHSHFGFQHELGVSFPLIVDDTTANEHPNTTMKDKLKSARDTVLFLEDFGAMTPDAANVNLTDAYSVYDSLVQSWNDTFNSNDWSYSTCNSPALESDVSYKYQIANGHTEEDPYVVCLAEGERTVRLRIINSAAFHNYQIQTDFDATLITTDANYVKPVTGRVFWIAVAQRIDLLVELPANSTVSAQTTFVIRAVAEGASWVGRSVLMMSTSNCTSGILSTQTGIVLPALAQTPVNYMDGWEPTLEALVPLPVKDMDRHYEVNLTGDNGFMSINQHSMQLRPIIPEYKANEYPLQVKYGERVCITFRNFNADSHPMHLHGHFFQLVDANGTAVNGPIRDTLNVPRGDCNTVKVCFDAVNPFKADSPLHCHLTWHLAAGMFTTVEYLPADDKSTPVLTYVLIGGGALVVVALIVGIVWWACSRGDDDDKRDRKQTELEQSYEGKSHDFENNVTQEDDHYDDH